MKYAGFDIETEMFDKRERKHIFNVKFKCGAVVSDQESRYFTDPQEMWTYMIGFDVLFAHNASFDMGVLGREPLFADQSQFMRDAMYKTMLEHVQDTLLMAFLLDENSKLSLKELAPRYIGEEKIDFFGTGGQIDPSDPKTKEYVTKDAELTLKLGKLFEVMLRGQGLWNLYVNIDLPMRWALDAATQEGAKVDLSALARYIREVEGDVVRVEEKFRNKPYEININSPKQVYKCLYYFPQDVPKQKDGTPKTDAKTLSMTPSCALKPTAHEIMAYRKQKKLLSTFLLGMQRATSDDGLIHAPYNMTIAKTGRLSSGGGKKGYPLTFNMQNVTNKYVRVRQLVIAKPNTAIVLLDAKQLELRVLAHYSKDPLLLKTFRENLDPHTVTAAAIYGKGLDQVSDEERFLGKTANFAALYGATARGLEYNLGIDYTTAKFALEGFYSSYTHVRALKKKVEEDIRSKGYVMSLYGRRRRVTEAMNPHIKPKDFHMRLKEAFSGLVQGTAADLMKECCVNALLKLPPTFRFFLQVHDEFGFYVPISIVDEAMLQIEQAFESGHTALEVPIIFDTKWGMNWVEGKKGKKDVDTSEKEPYNERMGELST